jgi:transposase
MQTISKWSQKRHLRIGIITKFIEGALSREQAAELAGISERQVTRIAKEVKDLGAGATLHKNIGNKPTNSINADVEKAILEINSRPEYYMVNFLHFHDSLRDRHGILIPYSSLVSILKRHKKESPKKHKRRRVHRRRSRKTRPGELIQIDASPFDWLRNGKPCALHGAIDDATGEAVGLYLCQNECRLGYFEVMRQCILTHGVPLSLYSDRHTIFRSPKEDKLTTEELLHGKDKKFTQFGRAMDELGVNIIYARSAQAKGRVERMWETLQSRLPVEFALEGITTIDAANEYLSGKGLAYFNQKWAVEAEGDPIYVPLRQDVDIDTILCVKEKRGTDNAGVFSFGSKTFKIMDAGFPVIPKNQKIEVLIGLRIGIMVSYKGQVFQTIRYLKPNRGAPKKISRKTVSATKSHLRHGSARWKEIWHAEEYDLSLKFLYDLFLADEKALRKEKDNA